LRLGDWKKWRVDRAEHCWTNAVELIYSSDSHCTAYETLNFANESAKYGLKDTLAHIQLEHRSVSFLMNIIKANRWEEDVELQSGGNIHLIETQEQHDILATQLKAAAESGIDVSNFQWLSQEECAKVRTASGADVPWLTSNL
jgi:hypothetical protein